MLRTPTTVTDQRPDVRIDAEVRTVARVDRLPAPFRVPAAVAAASRLHGRLVLLALPVDDEVAGLHAELAAQPGVRAAAHGSRLFTHGLEVPWRQFQLDVDVGLAPMLGAVEFLTALRQLADDLLDGAGSTVVDWSPEHATADAVEVACSIYPDATVVVRPDLAAALPEATRSLVTVWPPGGPAPALTRPKVISLPSQSKPAPEPDSRLADRLIVVIGCGRSGTTWLEQLILAHPSVGGVARSESWIFQQLHRLWLNHSSPAGLSAWVDLSTYTSALRRYCDTVFTAALVRHGAGATHFVEKTPMHCYRLQEIAAVYPDAWVVHLLRDGRDVARSIAQVPFFRVPDPADAVELWRRVVAAVRRDTGFVRRFREVRYEDLHADPIGELKGVLAWVGLGTHASHLAGVERAVGERVSTHAGTSGGVGAGSWCGLPTADLARIYRRAGRDLMREGYASRRDLRRARLHIPAQRPAADRKVSTASRN
jgi:hypothetical protein